MYRIGRHIAGLFFRCSKPAGRCMKMFQLTRMAENCRPAADFGHVFS